MVNPPITLKGAPPQRGPRPRRRQGLFRVPPSGAPRRQQHRRPLPVHPLRARPRRRAAGARRAARPRAPHRRRLLVLGGGAVGAGRVRARGAAPGAPPRRRLPQRVCRLGASRLNSPVDAPLVLVAESQGGRSLPTRRAKPFTSLRGSRAAPRRRRRARASPCRCRCG
ncbi:hypothetical protein BU14_0074s0054 [Porphyra umbilicalis]|uniref:Uncharacterized protein n=1 Tax=Porphyra umbilicalis TaxID=2786 RepID=A0A1X6PFJ9_PORUM|nr:hypothetical protein BU14_0074s0054 [Porphyra umbilicalis]|eukprot:OSX79624.1 hypothetical protein BU14_0074s0054 [Porphyra umbilicalis]